MSDKCTSDADCDSTEVCSKSLFTSNVCKLEAKVQSCATSCLSCCASDAWSAGTTAVKELGTTAVGAASALIAKSSEALEDVLKDLSSIDVTSIVPDLVKQLNAGATVSTLPADTSGILHALAHDTLSGLEAFIIEELNIVRLVALQDARESTLNTVSYTCTLLPCCSSFCRSPRQT